MKKNAPSLIIKLVFNAMMVSISIIVMNNATSILGGWILLYQDDSVTLKTLNARLTSFLSWNLIKEALLFLSDLMITLYVGWLVGLEAD